MSREIVFDRKGRCPVCRKEFQSDQCRHTWSYVQDVVNAANANRKGQNFNRDVAKLSRKK